MGLNFFVGNNPHAPGYYERPRGLDVIRDFSGSKIAAFLTGKELRPSQVSRFWLERAWVFVRAQPGVFLRLTWDKFLFFWNAYEIPQVENVEFFKRFAPLLRWPLLRFSLLGPLGLLGMVLSLGCWRRSYFLLAFVFSLMVATVVFFVLSRLRLQVCSVLMVFAGYALVWLWDGLRARKFQRVVLAVVALVPLALLVNWPHPALNTDRDLAKSHNFMAVHLLKRGDSQEAFREYERAVALYPGLGETYLHMANLRKAQGQPDEARDLYVKALEVDPLVSTVHLNWGHYYARRGMWDQAIAEYRAEIIASPYNVRAREFLSRALEEKEKLESNKEKESDLSQPE
jgi:tetratricopeptide (TPR) repeat protein